MVGSFLTGKILVGNVAWNVTRAACWAWFVQISIRASSSSSSFSLLRLLLSLLLLLLHVVVCASLSRRHLSQKHHYILTESCRNAHYDTFASGKLLREVDLLVGSSLDELDAGDGVSGFDHVCDRRVELTDGDGVLLVEEVVRRRENETSSREHSYVS